MRHDEFIAKYRVPVVDPEQPRPELRWARRGEGQAQALIGAARRTVKGRRLAYVDSHFPWHRSGFRHADALALHALRPDTVFFSLYPTTDSFPAPVLPLADFPRVAPRLGVTDVYGVFLEFMAGIVGLRRDVAQPSVIQGLDLSAVIRAHGMRTHAGLYPGGGFTLTEHGFAEARRLVAATDTTFTWVPEVIERVEGVTPIAPAVIDTRFYAATERDFAERPLHLLFVADARPRKGLAVALEAFARLGGEPLHLHVVGPHDPADAAALGLGPDRVTHHGWLEREQIRDLHRLCHVFLSPVRAEDPGDPTSDGGVTDGFPTSAAVEAMSSGLLLLTGNPNGDHRQLRPGTDHVELPSEPEAFAAAIRRVLAEPAEAAQVAAAGATRVRQRFDVERGAADRLRLMGFAPDGARSPYVAPRRATTTPNPAPATMPEPSSHDLELLRAGQQALTDQVQALRDELAAAEARRAAQQEAHEQQLLSIVRVIRDEEPATRRLLNAARAAADYERPFTEPDPLVTVCIPTYNNTTALVERSIPSALAQDHPNIEVVVVGDTAPPETAEAIAALGDPRVRYENLTVRGPYPEDPRRRWLVAGTGPLNRAFALARGSWIAINNDDDAMRPDHVSTLLAAARAGRDEIVYGQLQQHAPDGSTSIHGEFPPGDHTFAWQLALQHRALLQFEFELSAELFGTPGDWDRARRLLRAGARFRMIDAIVCDYYPTTLWGRPGE